MSRSRFITVRGMRMHVRVWGDDGLPALWYLHGWLDTSASFATAAEALANHFQILALDQRGYGLSEWPADGYWFYDYIADFDALIRQCAGDAAIQLIGHSMGAQVASLYAGLRPAKVAKLAILDGLFLPDMPAKLAPKRLLKWLDQLQAAPREKRYASYAELAQRIQKKHPQLSAERAEYVARAWAASDPDGQIRLLADPKHRLDMPGLYKNEESMAVWRSVTAKTLFLDGGDSLFTKAIAAEDCAARRNCFAQHQQQVLPGAGHMLHFDQPLALAQALKAFFA